MRGGATQIIDYIWIDPAAIGLSTGAKANIKNLCADAPRNIVLVRAESEYPDFLRDEDQSRVRVIAISQGGRALKRELWVVWFVAQSLLRGERMFYTSWLPRLCLAAMLLPVRSRLFVHDLNIFRRRLYDSHFPQPPFPSRLHQYLSIRRATIVQSFARSVARQLGLLRRDAIPIVDQTVRVVTPPPSARPGNHAVIFLDNRSYKGLWALPRFFTSAPDFTLTVIGTLDTAHQDALRARGFTVRVLRPDNAEKFALLAAADFVIFASQYEGYGLPPREAAAVGTPALIARRAALLDIPAALSLSIERYGGRVDLAAIARLAAGIDKDALRMWVAPCLEPVSTSWRRAR